MKNIRQQVIVGLVCILLGFILAYQYKTTKVSNEGSVKREYIDLSNSIKSLENQRDLILKKVENTQKQVDKIEMNAAGDDKRIKELKIKIDRLKIASGLTDVKGKGVVITINVPDDLALQSSQFDYLGDMQKNILKVVNDLNSIGAKAISINDQRYVTNTKIVIEDSFISINNTKFSPVEGFTIKAVCDQNSFDKILKLNENSIQVIGEMGYKVDVSKKDNITVQKCNKALFYEQKR